MLMGQRSRREADALCNAMGRSAVVEYLTQYLSLSSCLFKGNTKDFNQRLIIISLCKSRSLDSFLLTSVPPLLFLQLWWQVKRQVQREDCRV